MQIGNSSSRAHRSSTQVKRNQGNEIFSEGLPALYWCSLVVTGGGEAFTAEDKVTGGSPGGGVDDDAVVQRSGAATAQDETRLGAQ